MLVKRNDNATQFMSIIFVFEVLYFKYTLLSKSPLVSGIYFLTYLYTWRTNPKLTLKCTPQAFLFPLGSWGQNTTLKRSGSSSLTLLCSEATD